MAQAGLLHLPAGTLDLCLCIGSAQCVTAELLPLQWTAAGSVPQCMAAGSLPAVSPPPLPADSLVPSLTTGLSLPPNPRKCLGGAVGRLPMTVCMGQKYLQST